ncbi:MAG: FAD-dependent oxidoreductase [Gammaproteobacteria bacterium]|nr:MAG: FAD-dependent oxidoreductase [Gammaproteobacteria bacterium]
MGDRSAASGATRWKLHRPRGIFSCGIEEPCAVVDLGRGARRTPNVRATLLPLVEGLEAVSVNCWPSVGLDLGALTGAFAGFLPAGFYYKTFMWPSWHVFEPAIRRMAGLGQAPRLPDPDHYEEKAADADVLVVGGGIAGLAAAVAAAHAGARTMLLAGSARVGGALGCPAPRCSALTATACSGRSRPSHPPRRPVSVACGSGCGSSAPGAWCSPPVRSSG